MTKQAPSPSETPYASISPEFWKFFSLEDVARWTEDARRRTVELASDLSDEQWFGPRLPTVNPLWWELGHVVWFQEKWVLRSQGQPLLNDRVDALYDSTTIPHRARWDLPLFSREQTLHYLETTHARVQERLQGSPDDREMFLHLMALFHEDMHAEAFLINRQTLGYPAPPWNKEHPAAGPCRGDVVVPGGTFRLGAEPKEPFVFDNEKWAHLVPLPDFAIAKAPVTQEEFAAFVDDNGYDREEWWSLEGWRWRQQAGARHPVYWRRIGPSEWQRRQFDSWVKLEPHRPVINVCWYEADAYCRWAGRRLPVEAEWEAVASGMDEAKRRFPWGDNWPGSEQASLGGAALGCAEVGAFTAGDSPTGCRQLIGNVWEWTASPFEPYPGFVPDPYREYSEPWFHTRKVLRGGCWATQSRLIRNTWRNFYEPDRRDVWAGFRTCPLDP